MQQTMNLANISSRTKGLRSDLGPNGADVARIDAGDRILPVFKRKVLKQVGGWCVKTTTSSHQAQSGIDVEVKG
jgi:hypothetical protein